MKNSEELKKIVRETYSGIALQSKEQNQVSCCGVGGCATVDYAVFAENYSQLEGYNPDADLGLGCGLPTEFAQIKVGDTVIDLGSGAGNDCFIARAITGESGKVIGVDMTMPMIDKARENAEKLNFNNVEFRFGDIEEMPVSNNVADVVVSNCVLNLVPDKEKAFKEIFRVLKPGGHFSISDVVLIGDLPAGLLQSAEMYAGCVSGALQKSKYLSIINQAGFTKVKVQKEKLINISNEILAGYLGSNELEAYKASGKGIYSITVYAEKPGEKAEIKTDAKAEKEACCAPGCCS
jgi:arsenite methyltransferase